MSFDYRQKRITYVYYRHESSCFIVIRINLLQCQICSKKLWFSSTVLKSTFYGVWSLMTSYLCSLPKSESEFKHILFLSFENKLNKNFLYVKCILINLPRAMAELYKMADTQESLLLSHEHGFISKPHAAGALPRVYAENKYSIYFSWFPTLKRTVRGMDPCSQYKRTIFCRK